MGLATWMPAGGIGEMFKMMSQFQPPPPEGAGAPLDWGRPEHVQELLGDTFELQIEERESTLAMPDAEAYWTKFSPAFGPVKTLLESLDDEGKAKVHDTFTGWLRENFGRAGRLDRAQARVPTDHGHAEVDELQGQTPAMSVPALGL